jgi:hypothetical protein
MKFEQGKLYSHKRMLDVNVYVSHVSYESPELIKLKVWWFLRSGLNLNISESINIRKHEFKNWYRVESN